MKIQIYPLLLAIAAGAAFGIWPLIASKARTTPSTIVVTAGIFLFVTGIVMKLIAREAFSIQSFGTFDLFKFILLGCLINACGYVFYGPLIKVSQELGTATFLIIMVVTMVVTTYIAGVLFLKEPLTWAKVLAILAILVSIVVLQKKVRGLSSFAQPSFTY